MPRGRPAKSAVRQNLIEILHVVGKGYGYDLYKVYAALFPKVTMRLIYYHLQKGVALGEIKTNKVVAEQGEFSWGSQVEKTYYELGEQARPIADPRTREGVQKVLKDREATEIKKPETTLQEQQDGSSLASK